MVRTKTARSSLTVCVIGVFLVAFVARVGASVKTHHYAAHDGVASPAKRADVLAQFDAFKATFVKHYASEEEENFRLSVFTDNLAYVDAENARQSSFTLGVTKFADLTHEEFKTLYASNKRVGAAHRPEHDAYSGSFTNGYTVPTTSLDWRRLGAVTPVKSQGTCGSCYTFATTGVVEGYYAIYKGNLPILSEQQLVDCARLDAQYGSYGCDGGDTYAALKYVADYGLNDEAKYPYTGKVGTCVYQTGPYKIGQSFRSYGCAQLVSNLLQQPTGVSVDFSSKGIMLYKSGVFDACDANSQVNHAILAVGWDAQGNWIVKNSWDSTWGENGFIRLKTGNMCHVCEELANAF